MKWFAPAKINLSLRIPGKRADGFHEIETLMVPLDFGDEIEIELGGAGAGIELICNDPTLPSGPENLVYLAAQRFSAKHVKSPRNLEITLAKQVPHGAGLGGGSSDAATVLLALNELFRTGLSVAELSETAASLGSDVPFFLYRGAAICRGRGERVQPVPLETRIPLLLLKPSFPVPTGWAYSRWADARELPGVRYQPQELAWGTLYNDLERPVFEKYLPLAHLKMWLLDQPEVTGALLSGSGSTVLAVLGKSGTGQPVAKRAQARFGGLWAKECRTEPHPPATIAPAT